MSNGPPSWQKTVASAFTEPFSLCRFLGIDAATFGFRDSTDYTEFVRRTGFGMKVPRTFAEKMEKGNPDDPLLRQVIPSVSELQEVAGFSVNPLDETPAENGILQKYHNRALLLVTNTCGAHCRFCFRRSTKGKLPVWSASSSSVPTSSSLSIIPPVEEIILSGGDPLTLTDSELEKLVGGLRSGRDGGSGSNPLRRIRIHTRLPILIPSRITPELVSLLGATMGTTGTMDTTTNSSCQFYMVLHVNHPNELDENTLSSLSRLQRVGVPLLIQTVLLRNINDTVETLEPLFRRCVNHGLLPYYLHQLDRVCGAAEFEVSITAGQKLIATLRERLPGFAVPQYVLEKPTAPCKTLL